MKPDKSLPRIRPVREWMKLCIIFAFSSAADNISRIKIRKLLLPLFSFQRFGFITTLEEKELALNLTPRSDF